jgi:predicted secreted protein
MGIVGKAYRNTGTFGTPVWVEMVNVGDITQSAEKEMAEVPTRAGGGWKAKIGGLKDGDLEFQIVPQFDDDGVLDDDDYLALLDSFNDGTPIDIAIMDGDITQVGMRGKRAAYEVASIPVELKIKEARTATIKLALRATSDQPHPTDYVITD